MIATTQWGDTRGEVIGSQVSHGADGFFLPLILSDAVGYLPFEQMKNLGIEARFQMLRSFPVIRTMSHLTNPNHYLQLSYLTQP